jgi:hypothetical protein
MRGPEEQQLPAELQVEQMICAHANQLLSEMVTAGRPIHTRAIVADAFELAIEFNRVFQERMSAASKKIADKKPGLVLK